MHLRRALELIRSALPCFQIFDRKNGIPDVKQRIEDTEQGRLVGQSPYQDRHRKVLLVAFVIGLINVVLFTAFATLTAFIYNVCTDIVGGVEVTLAERN